MARRAIAYALRAVLPLRRYCYTHGIIRDCACNIFAICYKQRGKDMSDTVSRSWFAVVPYPDKHGYSGTP